LDKNKEDIIYIMELNKNKTDKLEKRNYFAIERTFLAAIRTISIFAGISLLFINVKLYLAANIILICSILLIIVSLINFYLYKKKYDKAGLNVEHFHPKLYGILLIFILFLLLYYSINKQKLKL
jgi:uncharacterized membrane protein YidH (DUF202 family)|tara:strand:+ start:104 stop:475 length:372 start_codon:yes stop_codon:yes gene_type:complete